MNWTPEKVNAFWTGISGSKLDDLSFAKLNGEKLLNLVSPWFKKDSTVLDFGAGSGFLVCLLLDRGYKVAAFDPSGGRESALSSAVQGRENFLGLEHGHLEQTYDVVIFSEVIEHILEDDYRDVLARVVSFLNQDGILIITTPNSEDVKQKVVFCPDCQHFFHPWQHVRSIRPDYLVSEFESLGLSKEYLALVDFSNNAQKTEFGAIAERLLKAIAEIEEQSGAAAKSLLMQALVSNPRKVGFIEKLKQLFLGESEAQNDISNARELYLQIQFAMDELLSAKKRLASLEKSGERGRKWQPGETVDMHLGDCSSIVYVGRRVEN